MVTPITSHTSRLLPRPRSRPLDIGEPPRRTRPATPNQPPQNIRRRERRRRPINNLPHRPCRQNRNQRPQMLRGYRKRLIKNNPVPSETTTTSFHPRTKTQTTTTTKSDPLAARRPRNRLNPRTKPRKTLRQLDNRPERLLSSRHLMRRPHHKTRTPRHR